MRSWLRLSAVSWRPLATESWGSHQPPSGGFFELLFPSQKTGYLPLLHSVQRLQNKHVLETQAGYIVIRCYLVFSHFLSESNQGQDRNTRLACHTEVPFHKAKLRIQSSEKRWQDLVLFLRNSLATARCLQCVEPLSRAII